MGLKQILWYFAPYQKPIARFPREIALEENSSGMEEHAAMLIEAGYARTPKEAQRLLDKYKHPSDAIAALYNPRKGFWKRRLKTLLIKIDGSTERNPLKLKRLGGEFILKVDYSNDK